MEQKGMTPDDLWSYIEGHNLRNFDIDPSEIDVIASLVQNYVKKLKANMHQSRSLFNIDQIEARAIKSRTCKISVHKACSSISELCDMMNTFKNQGDYDKFVMIMEAALITKKKTQEILETLQAISDFEEKLHYEKTDTMVDLEKRNVLQQNRTVANEVESNSQELAFTYLPYWDTKIGGNSKEADTKKALEWFELTPVEAHNVCKRINCFTFRDFIIYYRTNLRLFTTPEIRELNKKGIDDVRIGHFTKLITFLSAQWMAFPPEVSSIISLNSVKLKLDLSQVKLSNTESLQSIIIAYFNCGNYLKRVDFSGTKLNNDISHVVNQIICKQNREKVERIADNEERDETDRERTDIFELEELNISGNPFSQKGIDQIAKVGQHIKSFGFDKCGIEKAVFQRFDRFLFVIKNLRVLSIEFNNIGNDGVKAVLSNLRNSASLYYLNISENMLTNDIITSIVQLLQDNHHLECLECERNM